MKTLRAFLTQPNRLFWALQIVGWSCYSVLGISAKIGVPFQKRAQAWILDARGQRVKEITAGRVTGKTEIAISPEHQTLWWEIAFP